LSKFSRLPAMFLPLGILTFRLRWNWRHLNSQETCSLELCEDKHDWFYSFIMTQPVVIQMRHSFLKYIY